MTRRTSVRIGTFVIASTLSIATFASAPPQDSQAVQATALVNAVKAGDVAKVKTLVDAEPESLGPRINAPGAD